MARISCSSTTCTEPEHDHHAQRVEETQAGHSNAMCTEIPPGAQAMVGEREGTRGIGDMRGEKRERHAKNGVDTSCRGR